MAEAKVQLEKVWGHGLGHTQACELGFKRLIASGVLASECLTADFSMFNLPFG